METCTEHSSKEIAMSAQLMVKFNETLKGHVITCPNRGNCNCTNPLEDLISQEAARYVAAECKIQGIEIADADNELVDLNIAEVVHDIYIGAKYCTIRQDMWRGMVRNQLRI